MSSKYYLFFSFPLQNNRAGKNSPRSLYEEFPSPKKAVSQWPCSLNTRRYNFLVSACVIKPTYKCTYEVCTNKKESEDINPKARKSGHRIPNFAIFCLHHFWPSLICSRVGMKPPKLLWTRFRFYRAC